MFYHNMGGSYGDDKTGDQTVDGVLLTDVQTHYWSGTATPIYTWFYIFELGGAYNVFVSGDEGTGPHGWAVRAGDVPVPAAVWLFGSGLLGLIGIARRKKAA